MIRFLTGTDTGIGKTLAAAALCRMEREAGRSILYCKPVQTGLEPGEPGDAAFVAAAAGVAVVECLRFPEPLAPAGRAVAGKNGRIDRRQHVDPAGDIDAESCGALCESASLDSAAGERGDPSVGEVAASEWRQTIAG